MVDVRILVVINFFFTVYDAKIHLILIAVVSNLANMKGGKVSDRSRFSRFLVEQGFYEIPAIFSMKETIPSAHSATRS